MVISNLRFVLALVKRQCPKVVSLVSIYLYLDINGETILLTSKWISAEWLKVFLGIELRRDCELRMSLLYLKHSIKCT
jgi:hypothetical protein